MYLSESFDPASATQRSGMGDYKRFCLALTNLAVPNQIALDLVHSVPMNSFVGNIAYVRFVAGVEKGGVAQGDLFNDPFRLGEMDEDRMRYTANKVVESFEAAPVKVMWTPCIAGEVKAFDADGNEVEGITVAEDGTLAGDNLANVRKVAYQYDNIVIPQKQLPTLVATMDNIPLQARARRIAVRYSQIAAFQAKTDYGMDMAGELARQAVAELNYEVDTEICQMLINAAGDAEEELKWSKTLPVGVSKMEHYAGFGEIIERGKVMIYQRTQKHMANVMLMAADCLPVLQMVPGFVAAPINDISGPFFAGTLNGLKCYVSPVVESGKFVLVVNKGAMEAAAGVYAPYMPVVPTAVLQGPDGATAQGWSTLYDCKMLNKDLVIAGQIVA